MSDFDLALTTVAAARDRIQPYIRRTPLMPLPLGDDLPAGLQLKLENLQVSGSFKARGAFNNLLLATPAERERGVLVASGGNHGLAIAAAARQLGVPATVYLPTTASADRADRIAAYGATVLRHGDNPLDTLAHAQAAAARTGQLYIHPFDAAGTVAGTGTLGLELLADVPDLDGVLIAIGGGGLIGGMAATIKQLRPDVRIIGVEPTGAAKMTASLAAGTVVTLPAVRTIADTLAPRAASARTLALTQRYVDEVVLVDDQAMLRAMRWLWRTTNQLVEPAGAAVIAAIQSGATNLAGSAAPGRGDLRRQRGGRASLCSLRRSYPRVASLPNSIHVSNVIQRTLATVKTAKYGVEMGFLVPSLFSVAPSLGTHHSSLENWCIHCGLGRRRLGRTKASHCPAAHSDAAPGRSAEDKAAARPNKEFRMRTIGRLLMLVAMLVLGVSSAFPAHARPSQVTAGELHALLSQQLGEHVLLASSATGAALGGRDAEFKSAAAALDANSVDLSKSIGLVYGADAEAAFLPLWRKHIGFFVDYTNAVAKKDDAAKKKATDDLNQYGEDFGAFLNGANPNLPKQAVVDLLAPHTKTLNAVIDAQAAGDADGAFTNLRAAYAHMDMVGGALAGAIAKQFPDKFAGAADDASAGLRAALTNQLDEHVYLAAMATNGALGGRDAEFKGAAAALDANSVDLSKSIGSVYGADAEAAFLPLWRKHIGFFVDYTNAVAKKDDAAKKKATDDLNQYGEDFGAFLNGANPNLPKQAVADLLAPHVKTLNAVIDAQAAGNTDEAFTNLRAAYAHMPMVANALTDAIVKQFPDKFASAAAPAAGTTTAATTTAGETATPAMPSTIPNTGADTTPSLGLLAMVAVLMVSGLALIVRSRRSA